MRTLKYIIGISLAVGLVACDDFLVETPQTAFEKEGIYNTVGSANAVLSGAYSTLAEYDYFGFNYFHVVNVTSGMGVSVKDNDKGLTAMNIEPTNYDTSKLSNTKQSWYFVANNNHTQPQGNGSVALNKYNAYYVGNPNEKNV